MHQKAEMYHTTHILVINEQLWPPPCSSCRGTYREGRGRKQDIANLLLILRDVNEPKVRERDFPMGK